MDLRIVYAIILSMLPISELRGGLPLAIIFAEENNVPLAIVFFLVVLSNVIAIFIAFYFFEHVHKFLIRWKFYRKVFEKYVNKMQKKVDKFEKNYSSLGFLALAFFVAIPFPATGAWSGCFISWILGLERKKSILAIILGVMIAGILVLSATLGIKILLA